MYQNEYINGWRDSRDVLGVLVAGQKVVLEVD